MKIFVLNTYSHNHLNEEKWCKIIPKAKQPKNKNNNTFKTNERTFSFPVMLKPINYNTHLVYNFHF